MRKTIILTLALLIGLSLCPTGAWAYTFPNNTLVRSYQGANPVNYNNPNNPGSLQWHDVIGDKKIFDTFGANLSGSTLTIFTNWGLANNGYLGVVQTADLFIDVGRDGKYDYAIQLNTNTGFGKIYAINAGQTNFKTSIDLFKGTGYIYGGQYNKNNPRPIPVLATSGDIGTTSVVWGVGDGTAKNSVAVNLAGLNLGNNWSYVWGAGTCGNDTAEGVVPIPGTVVLLGSGLMGLLLLGRRKLKKPLKTHSGS
jgi:hypothetical protein